MIHKRIDKVKNQDGMYLVFCTKTFEPVFLTNIDNSNIIMDSVAMNAGFQGIELRKDDKFYYISQLFKYYQEHDRHGFVNLVTFAKTMKSTNLAQVTLDYLNILRDSPIINVDGAFLAFIGDDSDRLVQDCGFEEDIDVTGIVRWTAPPCFKDIRDKVQSRSKHISHTW